MPRSVSLAQRLFAPVNIAPLVLFRIAFGIIMMVEVFRYWHNGWILRYFIQPKFFFTFYGFDWVRPWPGQGMYYHFILLGLLAAAIAVGLFYRVAAFLFFLGFTYVFLLDASRYLNHFYLVCLYSFLLVFVPAHRAFSIDATVGLTRRSSTAPAWSLWLLRAQMCIAYFMGGIAKLNSDWLHGEPMRMWLARRTHFPVIGPLFTHEWTVYAFSYGGLLFDLFISPLLIWKRTRWLAFILAAIFNMMNAKLFNIGIFPWLALGATVLLFFDYSLLGRWIGRLWRPAGVTPDDSPTPGQTLTFAQRSTLALLAAWFALQIAVPLRHLALYPGNPEWTEEGHRFSWRMKLRDKQARLSITAYDPMTHGALDVALGTYLTRTQIGDISDHPEMILQLCHHIADLWQREHLYPIEVRANAQATLNGRPLQPFIDPNVNLAAQPRTLGHAEWTVPLTTPLKGR